MSDPKSDAASLETWIDRAADGLAEHGWFVMQQAVSGAMVDELAADLDVLVAGDRLVRAGVGRSRDWQVDRDIRRDRIFWLTGRRPAHARLLAFAERLRLELNRRLFLALFEFEAHLALYPPGAFYRRHFDSFRGAANRMVSLILYLNCDWKTGDGGELVLYSADTGREMARIEPRAATLVLLMSEEVEHEVLESRIDRTSVAGWYRLNNTTGDYLDPPR